MTEAQVAFLVGFATVAFVLVLFYGPWQTWVVAWTRQRLFELRDVWFDAASISAETRDLPGTRSVREVCNSLIRNTDMMTWPTFVMLHILSKFGDVSVPKSDFPRNIHELPKEQRQLARRTINCATQYMVAQFLARSIVVAPIGVWMMWRVDQNQRQICSRRGDSSSQAVGYKSVSFVAVRVIRREIESATAASMDPRISKFMQRKRDVLAA